MIDESRLEGGCWIEQLGRWRKMVSSCQGHELVVYVKQAGGLDGKARSMLSEQGV